MPNVAPPVVRLRRARPLLGTLVDIGIEASNATTARQALAAAFAEIATVHRLMSFHEAGSDLARLNRARPGERVAVDIRTAEVLRQAEALRVASGGAFDCAVAQTLIASGHLTVLTRTFFGCSNYGGSLADARCLDKTRTPRLVSFGAIRLRVR